MDIVLCFSMYIMKMYYYRFFSVLKTTKIVNKKYFIFYEENHSEENFDLPYKLYILKDVCSLRVLSP